MSRSRLLLSVAILGSMVFLAAGCNQRNAELTYEPDTGYAQRAADFASGMSAEDLTVKKSEARAAYLATLGALRNFYMQRGYYDNQRKAEKEISDVERIKVFSPVQSTAAGFDVAGAGEVDLVERMVVARSDYYYYLRALNNAVKAGGNEKDIAAVGKELDGLQFARRYPYLLLADLPGAEETKPVEEIDKANELYSIAKDYFAHIKFPLMYSPRNMRMALEYFNRVIREYPKSDKVDDALFYAGEILKEYFNEDNTAIEYYRRAYLADPNTPHPVHFQRAVVLDFRLHNRVEAVKEYQMVLQDEADKPFLGNTNFAARRIRQLTQP